MSSDAESEAYYSDETDSYVPDDYEVNDLAGEDVAPLTAREIRDMQKNWLHFHYERYLKENCREMMVNMWKLTGTGNKQDIYEGINATLEFLLSHHLLQCDLSKRKYELSDAFYTVVKNDRGEVPIFGFKPYHQEILKNIGIRLRFGACRNKDVVMCLVSAIAFSLWFRFDFEDGPLSGTSFPNFLDSSEWDRIKVLFSISEGSLDDKKVSDNYERFLMGKCLESIGWEPLDPRYSEMTEGSDNVDAFDVVGCQMQRGGAFIQQILSEKSKQHPLDALAYENSVYPLPFIHWSGGFDYNEQYYLNRDLKPSPELQKMVFPWLEDWREKVKQEAKKGVSYDETLQFFDILDKFRSVILQDLVLRMEEFPQSVFCQHEVTSHPDFAPFVTELKSHMKEDRPLPSSFFESSRDHISRLLANPFGTMGN